MTKQSRYIVDTRNEQWNAFVGSPDIYALVPRLGSVQTREILTHIAILDRDEFSYLYEITTEGMDVLVAPNGAQYTFVCTNTIIPDRYRLVPLDPSCYRSPNGEIDQNECTRCFHRYSYGQL